MERVLPFLMVVIVVAKGVADRLGDSIILRRIRLKRLPFIQRMPHSTMKRARLTALDIVGMRDHPLLPEYAIQSVASVYRTAALTAWCSCRLSSSCALDGMVAMHAFRASLARASRLCRACRQATGPLIRAVLGAHPMTQIFIVVRPMSDSGDTSTVQRAMSAADDEEWGAQAATSSRASPAITSQLPRIHSSLATLAAHVRSWCQSEFAARALAACAAPFGFAELANSTLCEHAVLARGRREPLSARVSLGTRRRCGRQPRQPRPVRAGRCAALATPCARLRTVRAGRVGRTVRILGAAL